MKRRDICEKILFSEEEIQESVKRLGMQITKDYENSEIIFISVLNGSFMFSSDLLKYVDVDCSIDFIQVSTYGNSISSSGNFILKKDLSFDIENKHVIVLEDIVDSGYTISRLKEYLANKKPASLKVATFIDKPARRQVDISADYVGFVLNEDYFIVGYGLDYAQKYRNLPYVGVLKEHIYS